MYIGIYIFKLELQLFEGCWPKLALVASQIWLMDTSHNLTFSDIGHHSSGVSVPTAYSKPGTALATIADNTAAVVF